jgi:hypothetical protein
LTGLVKKIDDKVNEAAPRYPDGKKLGTYVIMSDAPGRAEHLRELAQKQGLRGVSLCLGVVPQRYELNPEAELTVVIYNPNWRNQQTVQANFALRQGELDEAKCAAIVEALAKVLPK